jgi:hypothetical protein
LAAGGSPVTAILIAASVLVNSGAELYTGVAKQLISQTDATLMPRDAPVWLVETFEIAKQLRDTSSFCGATHISNFFSPFIGKHADAGIEPFTDAATAAFISALARAAKASDSELANIPVMRREALRTLYEDNIFKSELALRAAAASSLSVRLREGVFDEAPELVASGMRHFLFSKIPLPDRLLIAADKEGCTLSVSRDGTITFQRVEMYKKGYIFCPNESEASAAICALNGLQPDGFNQLGPAPAAADPVVFVVALVHAVAAWNAGHLNLAMMLFGLAFPAGGVDAAWTLFSHGHAWCSILLPDGTKICLILLLECVLSRKLVASNTSAVANADDEKDEDGKLSRGLTIGCLGGYLGYLGHGETGIVMAKFVMGLKARRASGGAAPVLNADVIAALCSEGAAVSGACERRSPNRLQCTLSFHAFKRRACAHSPPTPFPSTFSLQAAPTGAPRRRPRRSAGPSGSLRVRRYPSASCTLSARSRERACAHSPPTPFPSTFSLQAAPTGAPRRRPRRAAGPGGSLRVRRYPSASCTLSARSRERACAHSHPTPFPSDFCRPREGHSRSRRARRVRAQRRLQATRAHLRAQAKL